MPRTFVLGPEHTGERIDKVITALLRDVSRATVQRWIAEERVELEGRPCRSKDVAREGQIVEVDPGPPPATRVQPDASVPFAVLYEDAYLIVVDKPPNLVVHPGRGHQEGTLVGGLLARRGFERVPSDLRDPEGLLRPGIVHRLDKDTSGVMVVAKDESAREGLKAQLAAHDMERIYLGIAVGVPPTGRIETFHERHRTNRLRFTSKTETGRSAVTHVAVEEELAGGLAAFVSCRLETGRTHQIRVHLAEQTRTPLLADALYGSPPRDAPLRAIAEDLGRQALHAAILGFSHPITGMPLRFEARPPDDFSRALARLRALG